MKNLFGLSLGFSLFLACNVVSAKAIDKVNNSDPQSQQKETKLTKEKPTKYDFSLFKFISPSKDLKKDSSLIKPKKQLIPSESETVYEIPRAFFKFS